MVAAPRDIGREWRLVVVENEVIAASPYGDEGSKCVQPGCPVEVKTFAEQMLGEVRWRPDPIFMLDVCEADGRLWLVEISGFSCSWFYQCDLSAVVNRVSEVAGRSCQRT